MYGAVLVIHSWLRRLVLVIGAALLAHARLVLMRRTMWTPTSDRFVRAFLTLLDTQMLLGRLLWAVFSPLSRTGRSDLGSAFLDAPIRFFTMEHSLGMLLSRSSLLGLWSFLIVS